MEDPKLPKEEEEPLKLTSVDGKKTLYLRHPGLALDKDYKVVIVGEGGVGRTLSLIPHKIEGQSSSMDILLEEHAQQPPKPPNRKERRNLFLRGKT
jgi:hypothetical protein